MTLQQTSKVLRLIPRLDIKGPNLIKGIHLEGLRVIGDPNVYAKRYYEQGADELVYMDCVASLYGRNSLADIIQKTVKDVFIPITVGGGIRSVEDALVILRSGADKIAINTAVVKNPSLITDLANKFGSQCVVLSIEAKRSASHGWEVYTDNGRERTGISVHDWVIQAVGKGVGEILLTSVDQEGTRKGFDIELIREVSKAVNVPVIASGGMGKIEDLLPPLTAGASALACADILHYERARLNEIKAYAIQAGIKVRNSC